MITVTEAKRLEEKSKIWTKEDDEYLEKLLKEVEKSIIGASKMGIANINQALWSGDRPFNIQKRTKDLLLEKLKELGYKAYWHGLSNCLKIEWKNA